MTIIETDLRLKFQLKFLGHGRFGLLGRSNMTNVRQLLADGRDQFIGLDDVTVDLDQADCCNTAGLALLLEWSTWCRSHGIRLIYDKPREELLEIVKINDVEEVLPFSQ
jgi:ABC-type transporter Mla MlaB component